VVEILVRGEKEATDIVVVDMVVVFRVALMVWIWRWRWISILFSQYLIL
jgi:hypothetical protein